MASKKSIIAKRDKEWRDAVMARDKCGVICKRTEGRLNAHHLIPKQFKECRWDLLNGIMLCFQHHKVGKYSAHQNAIWFADWLLKNRPEQYHYVIRKLDQIQQLQTKIYKSKAVEEIINGGEKMAEEKEEGSVPDPVEEGAKEAEKESEEKADDTSDDTDDDTSEDSEEESDEDESSEESDSDEDFE